MLVVAFRSTALAVEHEAPRREGVVGETVGFPTYKNIRIIYTTYDTMNLLPLLYVGFRLTPFIIVSFFVFSSLLSSDIRGIVFLGFLLLNCLFTVMLGNIIGYFVDSFNDDGIPVDKAAVCNALTIGDGERISLIPLNINIVSFTYGYLVYLVGTTDRVFANIPMIVFFAILLFSMIVWELMNSCASLVRVVIAIVTGAGFGVLFSDSVIKMNIPELQFFTRITGDELCSLPSDSVFQCTA